MPTLAVVFCLADTLQGATDIEPILQGYIAPLTHLVSFLLVGVVGALLAKN